MWNWRRRQQRAAGTRSARHRLARSFEQLESRLAMAGNVLAHVSGGNLIVIGDDAGATVTVKSDAPRPVHAHWRRYDDQRLGAASDLHQGDRGLAL
jgi:hypothetical protein